MFIVVFICGTTPLGYVFVMKCSIIAVLSYVERIFSVPIGYTFNTRYSIKLNVVLPIENPKKDVVSLWV